MISKTIGYNGVLTIFRHTQVWNHQSSATNRTAGIPHQYHDDEAVEHWGAEVTEPAGRRTLGDVWWTKDLQ